MEPKWGFKPNATFLSPTSRSTKLRMCRFCMKKHADKKLHPGAYVPTYCPLELYSSDPERVKNALCALWDDWIQSSGTINMLRIFVNGRVLDPSKVDALSPLHPLQTFSVLSFTHFVLPRNPQPRSSLRKSTLTTPFRPTYSLPICGQSSRKP